MTKYIKLYEDYNSIRGASNETSYGWNRVRDTLQTKLPFIIIDFKDRDAYEKCIKEELFDEQFAKQIYHLSDGEGSLVKHPSVFIFEGSDDLADRVNQFNKRFDIARIIVGEKGKDRPTLYTGGESVEFANDVINALNPDDMQDDDYYQIGGTYYKFVNT